jgi:hypothetical protein
VPWDVEVLSSFQELVGISGPGGVGAPTGPLNADC